MGLLLELLQWPAMLLTLAAAWCNCHEWHRVARFASKVGSYRYCRPLSV